MLTCSYCGVCRERLDVGVRFCDQCGAQVSAHKPLTVTFGPSAVHGHRIPARLIQDFGGYLLVEHVGEGGMGDVYRALQPWSGQWFALKLVRSIGVRDAAIRMLRDEAAIQARIVHPHVVRVFGLARDGGGRLAILQELVVGEDLAALMARRAAPMPERDVLWFGRQMAVGLAVAHAHRYVHADLKPSNFLIGRSDSGGQVVKLADFGIARSISRSMNTRTGRSGTPGYMSPEQIRGEVLTFQSDLYSLGCVLYELLTASPVHRGETVKALEYAHLHDAPTPLRNVRGDVGVELAGVIMKLLSKKPRARGFDADSLAATLQRLAGVG